MGSRGVHFDDDEARAVIEEFAERGERALSTPRQVLVRQVFNQCGAEVQVAEAERVCRGLLADLIEARIEALDERETRKDRRRQQAHAFRHGTGGYGLDDNEGVVRIPRLPTTPGSLPELGTDAYTVLVERAQGGDEQAWERLDQLVRSEVHNQVRRILAKYESRGVDWRAVSAEVLVRARQNLAQLDDPKKFEAWIYRIALNRSIDATRGAKRQPDMVELEIEHDNGTREQRPLAGPRSDAVGDAVADNAAAAAIARVLGLARDLLPGLRVLSPDLAAQRDNDDRAERVALVGEVAFAFLDHLVWLVEASDRGITPALDALGPSDPGVRDIARSIAPMAARDDATWARLQPSITYLLTAALERPAIAVDPGDDEVQLRIQRSFRAWTATLLPALASRAVNDAFSAKRAGAVAEWLCDEVEYLRNQPLGEKASARALGALRAALPEHVLTVTRRWFAGPSRGVAGERDLLEQASEVGLAGVQEASDALEVWCDETEVAPPVFATRELEAELSERGVKRPAPFRSCEVVCAALWAVTDMLEVRIVGPVADGGAGDRP